MSTPSAPTGAFSVAFADLAPRDRYKLLCATVIPRPIALVTTVDAAGVVNAAPYSFFNVFSEDPPLVVLGLQHKPGQERKDTTRNIAITGYFVVNLVDEALAEAMNVCAIDFPPEASEVDAAGLDMLPGEGVPVPRIARAPFALECRRTITLSPGPDRDIAMGEVVRFHAREGLIDAERLRVVDELYHPVGRLYGEGYARQHDRFALARETYEGWAERTGRGG